MSSQGPPLLVPSFPGTALLLTSPSAPGGKLIVKLKPETAQERPRAQTFILAGAPAGWAPPRPDGAPLRLQLATGIRTVLLSKAGEEPPARAPPAGEAAASCTSKGVYENYRRWQRYKALARRHFPGTPDAEALACFFIPVLRSLTRLRPELALEEGVPCALQEWEHSSNFERMIFYEMAEKFMEFEAEEELQIQKMKLLSSSHFQSPPANAPKVAALAGPDPGQQQVYIPKKVASKGRQTRRRHRHPPGPLVSGELQEIPPEAVQQYAEIMEGLQPSWEEEAGGRGEPQTPAEGAFPDPALLQYIEQLCADESFVCKVEAVIHPQFLAQLLSPEKKCDPLDLTEVLEEELGLTPSQLVEKRLLALSQDELRPPACPAPQCDSTPSQSEEEDEGRGLKGPASHQQTASGASPTREGRTKDGALGVKLPDTSVLTPTQMSQPCQQHPGKAALEDAAVPGGPSLRKRGGQGSLSGSLRSQVERMSQHAQGQDKDGGQREGVAVTIQPESQAWSLRSQGENLVGPAHLESALGGYRKDDGGQEGKVKGRSEPAAGQERVGDAPMRAECGYRRDNVVEPGAPTSTLDGHGKQDGCHEELVNGQAQAGSEGLENVSSTAAQIVRSCKDAGAKQRALEATLDGPGKQDGVREGEVRGQNQEAARRQHGLQSERMDLSGSNVKREGGPVSTPTRPREQEGSPAGQPTKLESRVCGAHPTALVLSRANGQLRGVTACPLGVEGRGEGERPPMSNTHGQRSPDLTPLGLSSPERPTVAPVASEAESSRRAELEPKFMVQTESRQPPGQDSSHHEGNGISTMARPGGPGQREARATRSCGNGTRSRDDGKEVRETRSAMGDGPSKMAPIPGSELPPGDAADAGKHSDDEEDDEELSVFSSLLASKLRLSSPEVGSVPATRDRVASHGKDRSPSWEPGRWAPMRRRSTRLCPGGVLRDPSVRRSHKRKSDITAARRSKRLRSQ